MNMKTTNNTAATMTNAIWTDGSAVITRYAGHRRFGAYVATVYILSIDGMIIDSRRPGSGNPTKAIAQLQAKAAAVRAYAAPAPISPADAIDYCDDCGGVEAVVYDVARWTSEQECRCSTEGAENTAAQWV